MPFRFLSRAAGCALVAILAGSCNLSFPEDERPVEPHLKVYAPQSAYVGDTIEIEAIVYDQDNHQITTENLELVRWSFPKNVLDSVEILNNGTRARFRTRVSGTVELSVRTVPSFALGVDSARMSIHVRWPWRTITAGDRHTCARASSSYEIFCWGDGSTGAIGAVRDTPNTRPFRVGVSTEGYYAEAISSGMRHSCSAIYIFGEGYDEAYCWGSNENGELGIGLVTSTPLHQPLALYSGGKPLHVFTVSAGGSHTCAIGDAVYCWGAGDRGQLGFSPPDTCAPGVPCSLLPRVAWSGRRASSITTGMNSSCFLLEGGEAYCWGDNRLGQAGTADIAQTVPAPSAVRTGQLFVNIDAGYEHTCAVTATHVAYCWGSNRYGELGVRSAPDLCDGAPCSRAPIAVAGGSISFTSIAAGDGFTCGITLDERVYCWGSDSFGQTGGNGNEWCGDRFCTPIPQAAGYTFQATQLTAGGSHACYINRSRDAYCWGRNREGQLGDSTTVNRRGPVLVTDPAGP